MSKKTHQNLWGFARRFHCCYKQRARTVQAKPGNSMQVRHEGQNFKMLFAQTSFAKLIEYILKFLEMKKKNDPDQIF
jgi:hypothetical protein